MLIEKSLQVDLPTLPIITFLFVLIIVFLVVKVSIKVYSKFDDKTMSRAATKTIFCF